MHIFWGIKDPHFLTNPTKVYSLKNTFQHSPSYWEQQNVYDQPTQHSVLRFFFKLTPNLKEGFYFCTIAFAVEKKNISKIMQDN